MARQTINPDDMYNAVQFGFSHAAKSSGGTTIELAGQVAWDDNGDLVGKDDLAAQAAQAFRNLKKVLAAAGATPDDVTRIRTYVVNYSADKIPAIGAAIAEFYGGNTPAPNTLLGVEALAMPEFLIEIEATAVID